MMTCSKGRLSTPSSGSVTNLIRRIKKGDAGAADELLARFWRRLLGLARTKLQGKDLRIADEEDVVNSALAGFLLGAERGQYTKLHDRDDLWHLLVKITTRKAQKLVQELQRQKRCPRAACRSTSQGSADALPLDIPVEQIADPKPSPDLEALANETIEQLLNRLRNTRLRAIAIWKWQGYSNQEIALMLGCCARTVERKLGLIRIILG
jgi:DNA-directed RNA polymerase specialized sigma24 family protein